MYVWVITMIYVRVSQQQMALNGCSGINNTNILPIATQTTTKRWPRPGQAKASTGETGSVRKSESDYRDTDRQRDRETDTSVQQQRPI